MPMPTGTDRASLRHQRIISSLSTSTIELDCGAFSPASKSARRVISMLVFLTNGSF